MFGDFDLISLWCFLGFWVFGADWGFGLWVSLVLRTVVGLV